MLECCVAAADAAFHERYPAVDNPASFLPVYLSKIAKQYGAITENYASGFTIRAVDEVSVDTAANVVRVTCANNHLSHLIVVNERLYLFIWRVNMIVADYWMLDTDFALAPKYPAETWPTVEALKQVRGASDMYFGKRPLSAAGLSEFNRVVLSAHPVAQFVYTLIVDMAELFVFLHECSHEVPTPSFSAQFVCPSEFADIGPQRWARWVTELQVDASATYLLLLAASDSINKRFGVSLEDAKKVGAGLAFAGIDAALHTLMVLESIRFGAAAPERCIVDLPWAKHPPAKFRRNCFGFVSQQLAQKILQEADWNDLRTSIAGMVEARQHLFNRCIDV